MPQPSPSIPASRSRGFTLLELVISLVIVLVVLAVLLPALARARLQSNRERCADNLRRLGGIWSAYLTEHGQEYPFVPTQPGWQYAGVRFSSVDGTPFLDSDRPLSPYMRGPDAITLLRCPADRGIKGDVPGTGTGSRTAFRAFGTSYFANPRLLVARLADVEADRGLRLSEIATTASRLVVMGTPSWNEIREGTGRHANWHGDPNKANLLFQDGAVKYMVIPPPGRTGPAVFEPRIKDEEWLRYERENPTPEESADLRSDLED